MNAKLENCLVGTHSKEFVILSSRTRVSVVNFLDSVTVISRSLNICNMTILFYEGYIMINSVIKKL